MVGGDFSQTRPDDGS